MTEIDETGLPTPASIQRIYFTLLLGNTLAASFIWGINTIFLLDAGLSNLEAFAANSFFTVGMVLFEVPTGIVADTIGRRVSYLLGTVTLAATTLLYVFLWEIEGPFWAWAVVSMLLGLGFTFFSGAVEAWLVDALNATHFEGNLESVFGRGQIVAGVAMLTGSVAGGYIAQVTNLGVPFVLRGVVLGVMFVVAFVLMKDVGFTPEPSIGIATGRQADCGRLDRVRVAGADGEVDHARVAVHGGRRLLRVLRPAALPPRAVGEPEGIRDRRARGGDRRGRADRRRHHSSRDPKAVPSPDLGAPGHRARQLGHPRADRRLRAVLGRDRSDRGLGVAVRRLDADPPGLPERADPVAAARDDPLLRLDAGLDAAASSSSRCSDGRQTSGATRARTSWAASSRLWRCRSSSCRAVRTRRPTRRAEMPTRRSSRWWSQRSRAIVEPALGGRANARR